MAQQIAVMVPLVGLAVAGVVLLSRRRKHTLIPPDHGAFILRMRIAPPPPPPPPAAPYQLTGMTFAVKDNFDVAGSVSGLGNPTWKDDHREAGETAPCVLDLINNGAMLEGKTHMDDMAYSILGTSSLLATPVNPLAPQHMPGGSSSGSAVAVAAGLVDFALGTDTAGSIRVPAANCGVLGFRPTHGAISMAGVLPMSPSLDTVGLLAQDPQVLRLVAHILLHLPFTQPRQPIHIVIANDLFDVSACPRAQVTEPLIAVMEALDLQKLKYASVGELLASQAPSLAYFSAQPSATQPGQDKDGGQGKASEEAKKQQQLAALQALAKAQALLQRHEFAACHGAWVASAKPRLHPHVATRVEEASRLALAVGLHSAPNGEAAPVKEEAEVSGTQEMNGEGGSSREVEEGGPVREKQEGGGAPDSSGVGAAGKAGEAGRAEERGREEEEAAVRAAFRVKEEVRHALNELLKNDGLLALPVVPDVPLKLNASQKAIDEYRSRAMLLLSLASMSGLPQVVVPVGQIRDGPNAGLPLSLSFIARSGADRFLLDAAMLFAPSLPAAFQEVIGRRLRATSEGAEAAGQGGRGSSGSGSPAQKPPSKSAAEVAKDKGNAAYKEKRYQDAIDCYSQAIKLDPCNATFYSNRAMAYLQLQNWQQVEVDCSAALRLDKKNVKAMLRRGTAREFLGFYQEAYQDFHEALVLEPTNKTALDAIKRLEHSGVL